MSEQHHCCAICKRNDIKLYRYYQRQLREREIFCRAHAPEGLIEQQVLVPLFEDLDGGVWGHFNAPATAIARWGALPEE